MSLVRPPVRSAPCRVAVLCRCRSRVDGHRQSHYSQAGRQAGKLGQWQAVTKKKGAWRRRITQAHTGTQTITHPHDDAYSRAAAFIVCASRSPRKSLCCAPLASCNTDRNSFAAGVKLQSKPKSTPGFVLPSPESRSPSAQCAVNAPILCQLARSWPSRPLGLH